MNVSLGAVQYDKLGEIMGRCQWHNCCSRASAELEPAIFFQEYLAKDFGSQDAINNFSISEPHL